jgi:hypothetical protein
LSCCAPADRFCRKLCIEGSLDEAKAEGKIVVCIRGKNARVAKGEAVRQAGGVGFVLVNDEASGNEMIADAHVLPATHITYNDGRALLAYLNSTRCGFRFLIQDSFFAIFTYLFVHHFFKKASLLSCRSAASGYITVPTTALGTKPAPFMAAFSSQGPNTVTPQILKVQKHFPARSASENSSI